jgi:hypothetical protein
LISIKYYPQIYCEKQGKVKLIQTQLVLFKAPLT